MTMCAAKELQTLNRLGMRLAWQGHCKTGLSLLALALRITLRRKCMLQEARIRNNMALVFYMAGKPYLARRQLVRAMGLVAMRIGVDNRFYRTLQQHLLQTLTPPQHNGGQQTLAA